MKLSSEHPLRGGIPRSGSLLHRLQHAPGQDGESYLDQFMTFLDDPPAGIRDRWKRGAEMCAAWGVPCTGASVWRLHRSFVAAWRSHLAHEAGVDGAQKPWILEEKAAQMIARRICEILAEPPPLPQTRPNPKRKGEYHAPHSSHTPHTPDSLFFSAFPHLLHLQR